MRRVNRRQAGKALLVVGGGFAVLGLMFASYWHNLNVMPDLKIPTPVMPAHNARDLFIQASNGIQDGAKIDWAMTRRRVGTFARAMPGMTPPSLHANKDDRVYTPKEQIALVRENAATLQTFRQGLTLPYQEVPMRSFHDTFPHFAKFRALARLLALEMQTRAAQGDWKGAVDSQLDRIQFGEMILRGGNLISLLDNLAVQQFSSMRIGNAVEHLTSAQARAEARRAEAIYDLHVPYANTVQEEKWSGQASMLAMFRSPDWRRDLSALTLLHDDDKRSQIEKLKDAMKAYFVNRSKVLYDFGQYMNQQIANARLPAAANPTEPAIPDDPINQVMLGIEYNKLHMRDAQAQSQIAQLALRLALRAYHEDHHQYPNTLNELVPAYLPRLPDDPTALQGGFGYTRDKVGFTLISGNPPPPPKHPGAFQD